jgi:hypothetical protein
VVRILEGGVAQEASRERRSGQECAKQEHDDSDQLDDACGRGEKSS